MASLLTKLFGGYKYGRFYAAAKRTLARINKIEKQYQSLADSDLPKKTEEFSKRAIGGESLDSLLPEAFALVKNAARRMCGKSYGVFGNPQVWNMVPYDVQIMGAIALHKGMVAEIATGEGKTLIATLCLYLNALTHEGCHVATVNEYLAMRDAQWMGALFNTLGLTCAYVIASQDREQKKQAYMADIVYSTASELGFDYLRDNSMSYRKSDQVQRDFNFCLVDEADSILIDEARTPLIISGSDESEGESPYQDLLAPVENMVKSQKKLASEKADSVLRKLKKGSVLDDEMLTEIWLVKKAMPRNKILRQILDMNKNAKAFADFELKMSADYNANKAYKLKETLYYTVDEKKQQVDITEMGRKFLSPSDDAFVLPNFDEMMMKVDAQHLGKLEANQRKQALRQSYSKKAEYIHALTQLLKAYVLFERDVEYIIRNNKIEIIDKNTGRVMEGRRWSEGLHQAVEAKERVEVEPENRTYATISIQNYFRLYKKLAGMTGTAESAAEEFADIYKMNVMAIPTNKPCRRFDFPDLVFKTKREKDAACAVKIREANAKGQPVLVGTSSVEDSELLSRLLKLKGIKHTVLNAKNDAVEAEIVAKAGSKSAVTISTNMAGRGTDIKLADGVEDLGGLLVLSTEHHESKRVDRQLQGRCARQGDKGQSLFIVSLEDDIFRLHADTSFLAKVLKTKHKDNFALSHPIFSHIVEKAQKKMESENFSIRKQLLEFDNVSNTHREVIYAMRNKILSEDSNRDILENMIRENTSEKLAQILDSSAFATEADAQNILDIFAQYYPISLSVKDLKGLKVGKIADILNAEILKLIEQKTQIETPEFENMIEKSLLLNSVDDNWRDHLTRLEDLQEAIFLRSYGQKNPVYEYKIEAFKSFEQLMSDIRESVCSAVLKVFANRDSAGEFMQKIRAGASEKSVRVI